MRTKTLLLFFVLSFATMAQTYHLKTTNLYILYDDQFTEQKTVVNMTLDTDFQRLVINSSEKQILDYEVERSYYDEDDGVHVIECNATDTDYVYCKLEIHLSEKKNDHLVILHYRNVTYGYAFKIL